ncbi:unnamed protein product [Caenorhabditis auriculariae]|uniref:Uncharacterized protein n=1 Tax=Caenorhabditis auriculariae TaxID=2777116 RepID=A0A8S1HUV2_9PELO|nr:unnamed protein product [Caenorhabditis auriculariae]
MGLRCPVGIPFATAFPDRNPMTRHRILLRSRGVVIPAKHNGFRRSSDPRKETIWPSMIVFVRLLADDHD